MNYKIDQIKKLISIFLGILFIVALNSSILAQQEPIVGSETIEGYQQIFYETQSGKKIITNDNHNNTNPYLKGDYIVFEKLINGAGQVFLYHIPSESSIQLTHTSTNLNPMVSEDGKVVWERWVVTDAFPGQGSEEASNAVLDDTLEQESEASAEVAATTESASEEIPTSTTSSTIQPDLSENILLKEGWQIVVFDGIKAKQITQGSVAINPFIEGETIAYSESLRGGVWTAKAYSLVDDSVVDISAGTDAKYVSLSNGKIYLGKKAEVFPLNVSDLLLLDFEPLVDTSSPQTVSEREIIEELLNNIENQ